MRDTDCDPILNKRHICLLSVIKYSGSLNLGVPLTQLTTCKKATWPFSWANNNTRNIMFSVTWLINSSFSDPGVLHLLLASWSHSKLTSKTISTVRSQTHYSLGMFFLIKYILGVCKNNPCTWCSLGKALKEATGFEDKLWKIRPQEIGWYFLHNLTETNYTIQ